ncbi:MAG: molecular chaperone DnaJ [Chloroflexota bacterium]|nr:molecular chaperone DnaJ [Chloroflexota bacterium]
MKRGAALSVATATSLLGVKGGATVDEVMAARRAQAKIWHPDINPRSGSAERMGLINQATDILCDHIRRGGEILGGGTRPPAASWRRPPPTKPPSRVFEVRFAEDEVGVPVLAPDRQARLDIDEMDALHGGGRTVRFVRREPGSCTFCAGLGAVPSGPKQLCRTCRGENALTCPDCEGRGWIHLAPGSCRHCDGTGAGLVERSVHLKLPPGIRETRRTLVRGWGDVAPDGSAGNLWVDLVPAPTAVRSGPWRFDHYGHNWPRPEAQVTEGWIAIANTPLPDEEMRELGFWRDPETDEWLREAPSEGPHLILDMIRQRQFFVPQTAS